MSETLMRYDKDYEDLVESPTGEWMRRSDVLPLLARAADAADKALGLNVHCSCSDCLTKRGEVMTVIAALRKEIQGE